MSKKIFIVGGVAAGASCAARLRRLDENAEIIIFEKGEYVSFANCGLPYYIGGTIKEKSSLTLQTPQSFHSRFNIDVRIKNEVISIDKDKKRVKVKNLSTDETYEETYDKLVLTMGAKPIKDKKNQSNENVFTLRNIPDTYKIKDFIEKNKPKTAAIVGGGYIGIEMAENLFDAGINVTVYDICDQIISVLDYDVAVEVQNYILSKGIDVKTNTSFDDYDKFDLIIYAVGVRPESSIAINGGIECTEKGSIIVNDNMQTSDSDIYAGGDAVLVTEFITKQKSMIPLAGPANKQGRIIADNICGINSQYQGTQASSVIKVFDMVVATTGINEKTAKRLNLNYEKSFTYSSSHAGYYPNATNMSIKMIFEKENGKILGAQIVGFNGVDKRCDVIATAIRFNATAHDLTNLELCYAPPFSSAKDPVNMAGYVIENIVNKKVEIFHWHDVESLKGNNQVILLDVRTKLEYDNSHIEGFINIPLDDLRKNIRKLDNKEIYVHCQSGLRSYIACRILMANGFKCYNLSGGYRLYAAVNKKVKVNLKNDNSNNRNIDNIKKTKEKVTGDKALQIDACGLQCPGPIVKLSKALNEAKNGEVIKIKTTDPAFASDIEGFCRRTGNKFLDMQNNGGVSVATIMKAAMENQCNLSEKNGKNFIVFSGDLDKAIASFIMANASVALGRKTSMFFTFWGLNVLRKSKKIKVKKDLLSKMFSKMMPRGSEKLSLSKMNMGGMGAKMIRGVMKKKNVDSLEDLIKLAIDNGVELVACSMSMDVMGIKPEELIDGVKLGGAAAMLAHAEESDMSLFI